MGGALLQRTVLRAPSGPNILYLPAVIEVLQRLSLSGRAVHASQGRCDDEGKTRSTTARHEASGSRQGPAVPPSLCSQGPHITCAPARACDGGHATAGQTPLTRTIRL
ncbi:hypothetical protein AcV7_007470 [Taiwanofungus camphoratus]|nr:hypothetical protein AcV7_007470 [Antrodia cinnamomea]